MSLASFSQIMLLDPLSLWLLLLSIASMHYCLNSFRKEDIGLCKGMEEH